jgi:hypothetical protein
MIVPIIGAPGTGKTTLARALSDRYGIPHFEMSWVPEFTRMNGCPIPYEADERVALEALIAVAKVYEAAGHNVVCVSDFRLEVWPLVQALLGEGSYQTVKLICSDPALLSSRVLDPTRSSGFRDAESALRHNAAYTALQIPGAVEIDVAEHSIDNVVQVLVARILVPNEALDCRGRASGAGTVGS